MLVMGQLNLVEMRILRFFIRWISNTVCFWEVGEVLELETLSPGLKQHE
jgi:hypothetical protein